MDPLYVDNVIKQYTAVLESISASILIEYPISDYIKSVQEVPEVSSFHKYITPKMKRILTKVQNEYGMQAIIIYNKLVLLHFIKIAIDKYTDYPESIAILFKKWFERTISDLSNEKDEEYHHKNDLFIRNIGVCSMNMFPSGEGALVELAGISRKKILFGNGIRQFVTASVFIAQMGGFKPYYSAHLDARVMDEYSRKYKIRSIINECIMLQKDKRIKGKIGNSWYYDPAVRNYINPRLRKRVELPINNGARIFRYGTNKQIIERATATSNTRRKLYQEGTYLPTSWIYIWPRDLVIEYVNKKMTELDP